MWFDPSTITIRVSITLPCSRSRECDSFDHTFIAETTVQIPLLLAEEKAIRAGLYERLDPLVAKFMELHHTKGGA